MIAYCLMPNHFHLLIRPSDDGFAEVMHAVGVSYGKAINRQEKRVGPLFQGRFKAVRVDTEEGLWHLSRYIHLNPVSAGLARRPEDWEMSSYREYVGLRPGTLPDPTPVLTGFSSRARYREFVECGVDPSALGGLMLDQEDER